MVITLFSFHSTIQYGKRCKIFIFCSAASLDLLLFLVYLGPVLCFNLQIVFGPLPFRLLPLLIPFFGRVISLFLGWKYCLCRSELQILCLFRACQGHFTVEAITSTFPSDFPSKAQYYTILPYLCFWQLSGDISSCSSV